ncbi:MAG: hypothetical protein HY960_15940 [Ignavibacteriae bacterium]|nr:hypothetical protein [Ignavibacteriota bacterium]
MKKYLFIVICYLSFVIGVDAQVENVPVSNPVYYFLKRMEVKGVIEKYRDAILPLSRNQVAIFLQQLIDKQSYLTETERLQLEDFITEFQFDISQSFDKSYSLIDTNGVQWIEGERFNEAEKYLYSYNDSVVNLFVDGLLTFDALRSEGDALGKQHSEFLQFGGRVRGTIYDKLGFYLQVTNAQFWGSRDVLRRDKQISQAYTLGITDAQNFDFVEGYARYASGIVSAQIGRERLLWGNGYGDKMILSDNVRLYDFIRADIEYKSFKYTFLHAWLMGQKTMTTFHRYDNTFSEPVLADKYFGAHRFEFAFSSKLALGFQEMVIYSNRSPDLAYLNPVTFIESAQRSREERDNVLWSFDAKTHFINNTEIHASIVFDDINFPKWGTSSVQNKFAYQLGAMVVDPFNVDNTSLAIEYTRAEPYIFSHNRSRDNDYGSLGRIMSHHIGPNSDSWFFKFDYQPTHRLSTSLRFEMQREGENVFDSHEILIQNVGGNFLIPHRDTDPQEQEFLAGNRINTYVGQAFITYEIVNEVFFDARYQFIKRNDFSNNLSTLDRDFGIALRVDF